MVPPIFGEGFEHVRYLHCTPYCILRLDNLLHWLYVLHDDQCPSTTDTHSIVESRALTQRYPTSQLDSVHFAYPKYKYNTVTSCLIVTIR